MTLRPMAIGAVGARLDPAKLDPLAQVVLQNRDQGWWVDLHKRHRTESRKSAVSTFKYTLYTCTVYGRQAQSFGLGR
jgi:hypothetical protein